jgi:hypothetical protein
MMRMPCEAIKLACDTLLRSLGFDLLSKSGIIIAALLSHRCSFQPYRYVHFLLHANMVCLEVLEVDRFGGVGIDISSSLYDSRNAE